MKKILTQLCAIVMAIAVLGCGFAAVAESDQEAADRVAALIDAIYVQQRTEETDAQCAAAKEG